MHQSTGATVQFSVTATDPVYPASQLTILCSPTSGSTFPIGTTKVKCKVSDPGGEPCQGQVPNRGAGSSLPVTTQISVVQGLPSPVCSKLS